MKVIKELGSSLAIEVAVEHKMPIMVKRTYNGSWLISIPRILKKPILSPQGGEVRFYYTTMTGKNNLLVYGIFLRISSSYPSKDIGDIIDLVNDLRTIAPDLTCVTMNPEDPTDSDEVTDDENCKAFLMLKYAN